MIKQRAYNFFMYTIHHRIATSDVGRDKLMKVGAIGLLMQDCCMFQMEEEPKFSAFLQENAMAVFMASRQIDIVRLPSYGEEVAVSTWVHGCRGFYGLRNTVIRDAAGELCVASFSIGAFVKVDTGAPYAMPKSAYEDMVSAPPLEMEYLPRKIALPAAPEFVALRQDRVVPGYLDANGHLNAGRALDIAAGCLEYTPRRVRVEYKAQGKPGAAFAVERAEAAPGHTYMRLRGADDEVFSVFEFTK